MREVLDRLKAQLLTRLPLAVLDATTGFSWSHERIELPELGAIASAVRDYMEAELIFKQASFNAAAQEVT